MKEKEIRQQQQIQRFLDRLALRLKEYREKNKLTQDELAKELNRDKSTISRWESGQQLSLEHLAQLSQFYGCPIGELVGYLEDGSEEQQLLFTRRSPQSHLLTHNTQTEIQRGSDILLAIINGATLNDLYQLTGLKKYRGNRDLIFALLRTALFSGELTFTHIPRSTLLEEKIVEKFPSTEGLVYVVDVPDTMIGEYLRPELVAWVASLAVLSIQEQPSLVGLGSGHTISRMCAVTPPKVQQFSGTCWLPLIAYSGREEFSVTSANQLAMMMKYRHYNTSSIYLPHILPEQRADTSVHTDIQNAWENLTIAFVGGSGWDEEEKAHTVDLQQTQSYIRIFRRLEDRGLLGQLAGEFMGYILDNDGNILSEDETLYMIDAATTRIPLRNLQQCIKRSGEVYFIGTGKKKARIIRAALKQNYVNGLVVDRRLATELLK